MATDPAQAGSRAQMLLCRPLNQLALTRRKLNDTLRRALVCTSADELAIVGLHLYHRLPIEEVAERLSLGRHEVQTLFDSIDQRVRRFEQEANESARCAAIEAANVPDASTPAPIEADSNTLNRAVKQDLKEANLRAVTPRGSLFTVRCLACGATWEAQEDRHGRRLSGWRKCPNGCNAAKLEGAA